MTVNTTTKPLQSPKEKAQPAAKTEIIFLPILDFISFVNMYK